MVSTKNNNTGCLGCSGLLLDFKVLKVPMKFCFLYMAQSSQTNHFDHPTSKNHKSNYLKGNSTPLLNKQHDLVIRFRDLFNKTIRFFPLHSVTDGV